MALNVLAWNARSLRNKHSELSQFLLSFTYEILLISETHLDQLNNFSIPNYTIYRVDRRWGGVAILIKKSIPHSNLRFNSLDYAESISIQIDDSQNPFSICCLYCSPAASRKKSIEFFEKALNIPGKVVFSGDFNAKHQAWNNSSYTLKGVDLYKLCMLRNLHIHAPDGPTIIPSNNAPPSVIDFVISKHMSNISNIEVLDEFSSDHSALSFTIFTNMTLDSEAIFNFKRANWKKYLSLTSPEAEILSNRIDEVNSISDIDEIVERFSEKILSALDQSVPKSIISNFRHPYSAEIDFLRRNRNRCRNLYKATGNNHWKSSMNQLNRQIRRKTAEFNQEVREDIIGELTIKNNSLWKHTKMLKMRSNPVPPLIDKNGNFAYTNSEKAQTFAETFEESHKLTLNSNSPHDQKVADEISKFNRKQKRASKKCQISESEISQILKNLKTKKSPGPDKIPNIALRTLMKSKTSLKLLHKLFNTCIKFSYFPQNWKFAKICAIPKKAQSSADPKCYRPISLISCLGKVFEATILNKLSDHENDHNIFIKQQFGFRRKHSTVQQILRITENASLGFNNNQSTGLALLDLEKAFDSVWHDGLVYKLIKFQYPDALISLIISYLKDRKAFVEFEKKKSQTFHIPAGVPQGSLLSPHLFNIFINDIPSNGDCQLAMYADDTALFCQKKWKNLKSIKKSLLKSVNCAKNYFESWKIHLNSLKTEFIVLTKSTKMIRSMKNDSIKFDDRTFQWSESARYLGVILDNKLTFKTHIDTSVASAKSLAFKTLYCLLKRGNKLPSYQKLHIYRAIIRPVMSYACQIFNNCAKTHLKKIQVVQNSILRMAMNVKWDSFTTNSAIHEQSKVPFIDEFFEKLTKQFYESCSRHSNILVQSLGNYDSHRPGFRIKHKLPKRTNYI